MEKALTYENINETVNNAEKFFASQGVENKDIIKLRLSIEEALLNNRSFFGEEHCFSFAKGMRFRTPRFEISVSGNMYNPFAENINEPDNNFTKTLSRNIGKPTWKYVNGINKVLFEHKKEKTANLSALLIAIIISIVLGIVTLFAQESTQNFVSDVLLSPLLNAFLGFLESISTPFIFFSVVWGVYSIGDMQTFTVIGKYFLRTFILFLCVLSFLGIALLLPFYGSNLSLEFSVANYTDLYELILDIIPSNLFTPFTTGNCLQLLFLAVVVGASLLLLDEKFRIIKNLIDQIC